MKSTESKPSAAGEAAHTPTLNPFNADLVAAYDSPRYSGGEHRIAFSDQSNGIDGYVYGKSLEMVLARAEFATSAINQHAALKASHAGLVKALRYCRNRAFALQGEMVGPGGRQPISMSELSDIENHAKAALVSAEGI